MTNPIIPYSFVPGTKAKAQEINANFVSVADRIQSDADFMNEKVVEIETAIEFNNTNVTAQLNEINEVLETKANADASNTTVASTTATGVTQFGTGKDNITETRPAVIIETYISGATWYRLWSDNWIEQGGQFGIGNVKDTDYPIIFPKPFPSNNYFFNYSAYTAGSGSTTYWTHLDIGSYTSFGPTYMNVRLRSFYNRGLWYVCGYLDAK